VKPLFLDDLCCRLRRHGVSRRYVRRLAGEICDHYESLESDLVRAGRDPGEAQRLAEQQLGDPDALFDEIVSRQKFGRFVREHAFLIFVLAPIPFALAVVLVFALLGVGGYRLATRLLDPMNPALVFIVHWSFYGFARLVTPLMALGYCRLATKYRCPLWMAGIACALLCAAGGMIKVDFVQCTLSGSTKYFQRWGVDHLRLWSPLLVFAVYCAASTLRRRFSRRASFP
jgi:hypothetical protein